MYSPKTTEFDPAQPEVKLATYFVNETNEPDSLTQQQHISSVKTRGKELRLLEHIFEIVLLASVLGNASTELEIDCHSGGGNDHTRDPEEESKTNATR